jgi:hypothetical protein
VIRRRPASLPSDASYAACMAAAALTLVGRFAFIGLFLVVVVGGVSRLGPHPIRWTYVADGLVEVGLVWLVVSAWIGSRWRAPR